MNRLVIVGNGFDLAHGLPTGYCDFIDWYWAGAFKSLRKEGYFTYGHEDNLITLSFDFSNLSSQMFDDFKAITSYLEYIEFLENCSKLRVSTKGFNYIEFKNSLFKTICNRHYIQNWIDIENEYYKLLKECLKQEGGNSRVMKLNEEFDEVKKLLETYLNDEVLNKFNFKYNEKLLPLISIFKIRPHYLSDGEDFNYLNEFSPTDHSTIIDFDDKVCEAVRKNKLSNELINGNIQQTNVFLNFNYTATLDICVSAMDTRSGLNHYGDTYQIQIHGKLNDNDNPINFGFGDEMDSDYKKIEDKDDNEYLKNIKSFQYLQTSNYKRLLDFIENDKFQVYIMGHSCGLSDRILLNKIFEHRNCRSIKVFYHQFDEPKADGRTDNYTEIVQNISRHFNKKEMMREKIVNKTLCEPLPQIKLTLKENGSQ